MSSFDSAVARLGVGELISRGGLGGSSRVATWRGNWISWGVSHIPNLPFFEQRPVANFFLSSAFEAGLELGQKLEGKEVLCANRGVAKLKLQLYKIPMKLRQS